MEADAAGRVRTAGLQWGAAYVLDDVESATSLVTGLDATVESLSPLPARQEDVAGYLEEAIVPSLQRGRCFVAFSGGRDSSVILAAAVSAARRRGLPPPIPITLRFSDAPEADESSWQESVIKHLRISDWERITLQDELDVVGPVAAPLIKQYGPMWPPNAHFLVPMTQAAVGGTLLTGNGGDELFTPSIPRAYWVLNRRIRPQMRDLLELAELGLPRPVRARLAAAQIEPLPWLRGPARTAYSRELGKLSVPRYPWGRSILENYWRSRERIGSIGSMAAAAGPDIGVEHPFWEPHFLRAISGAFWRTGFASRDSAMRRLFRHLLPDELLIRSDKASFYQPFVGRYAREFIGSWDGTGLNPALVDAESLLAVWSQPQVDVRSFPLLQQAWRQRA